MKKPKWAKCLDKKSLQHIANVSPTGRASLRVAKENRNNELCFECRHIALILMNSGVLK